MKVKCGLELVFEDKIKVKNILDSVSVDDFDFVKSKVEENTLFAEIESKSLSSMIHTIDDYLSCVNVAEKIVKK